MNETTQPSGRMNMEAKHTPGPWTKNQLGGLARPYLVADTSNGLATRTCGVAFGEPTGGQGWPHINNAGFYTFAEAEANAHLIAAAPQLLEACLEMFLACDTGSMRRSMGAEYDRVFGAASAAIAKALGR